MEQLELDVYRVVISHVLEEIRERTAHRIPIYENIGYPVTKKIDLPTNWKKLLEKAKAM